MEDMEDKQQLDITYHYIMETFIERGMRPVFRYGYCVWGVKRDCVNHKRGKKKYRRSLDYTDFSGNPCLCGCRDVEWKK